MVFLFVCVTTSTFLKSYGLFNRYTLEWRTTCGVNTVRGTSETLNFWSTSRGKKCTSGCRRKERGNSKGWRKLLSQHILGNLKVCVSMCWRMELPQISRSLKFQISLWHCWYSQKNVITKHNYCLYVFFFFFPNLRSTGEDGIYSYCCKATKGCANSAGNSRNCCSTASTTQMQVEVTILIQWICKNPVGNSWYSYVDETYHVIIPAQPSGHQTIDFSHTCVSQGWNASLFD